MSLCNEQQHTYKIILDCELCKIQKICMVSIPCSVPFQSATMKRVGCQLCRSYVPMVFSCTKGRTDIWNYPRRHEGLSVKLSVKVETLY